MIAHVAARAYIIQPTTHYQLHLFCSSIPGAKRCNHSQSVVKKSNAGHPASALIRPPARTMVQCFALWETASVNDDLSPMLPFCSRPRTAACQGPLLAASQAVVPPVSRAVACRRRPRPAPASTLWRGSRGIELGNLFASPWPREAGIEPKLTPPDSA